MFRFLKAQRCWFEGSASQTLYSIETTSIWPIWRLYLFIFSTNMTAKCEIPSGMENRPKFPFFARVNKMRIPFCFVQTAVNATDQVRSKTKAINHFTHWMHGKYAVAYRLRVVISILWIHWFHDGSLLLFSVSILISLRQ